MPDSQVSLRWLGKVPIYVVLIFFTLLCVLPFWVMLVNGTRSTEEINEGFSLLPGTSLLKNWQEVTGKGIDVSRGFANSLTVAIFSTFLSIYFSALTAYGMAMYRFVGRRFMVISILVLIAVPPQLGLIGFYRYMADWHMLDNYLPLILPSIAAPGTVLFLYQYMKGIIHSELLDAARIDGSGEYSTFNRIMIPILTPGLATMAIFAFVGSWNSFIVPYSLITEKTLYTLPMIVLLIKTNPYQVDLGGQYLGVACTVLPILVFYAFASKFIIRGITVGSVKE